MEIKKYDCPNCKRSDTLMDFVGEIDKIEGRIEKDMTMSLSVQSAYTNVKRKIGDKATVAIIYRDICMNCGQEYIKQISTDVTTVQASTHQPKLIIPGNTMPKNLPGMN